MTARISLAPGNCSPRQAPRGFCRGEACLAARHASPLRLLLPVHRLWIEGLLAVGEIERHRAGFAKRHCAIKARAPAGMTGPRPFLLHLDPHGVLIAINAHLDHALDMARRLALTPERSARAAEIP